MEKETGFWPAIKDFFFRAGDLMALVHAHSIGGYFWHSSY